MKTKSIAFLCLCFGLISAFALLSGPSAAGAPIRSLQDDTKGKVGSFLSGMATDAEMMTLSAKWKVAECCGWTGTWTRRPNTLIYDASWKHTNGTVYNGIVRMASWNKGTGAVTFSRDDNHGTYNATLDASRMNLQRGTASWYPSGQGWSAVAAN